jgi:hypothetical protein
VRTRASSRTEQRPGQGDGAPAAGALVAAHAGVHLPVLCPPCACSAMPNGARNRKRLPHRAGHCAPLRETWAVVPLAAVRPAGGRGPESPTPAAVAVHVPRQGPWQSRWSPHVEARRSRSGGTRRELATVRGGCRRGRRPCVVASHVPSSSSSSSPRCTCSPCSSAVPSTHGGGSAMRPAPRRPRRWSGVDEMLAPRHVHEAGEGMPHLREEEGGQRGSEGGEEGGGDSRGRKAGRRGWRGCEP